MHGYMYTNYRINTVAQKTVEIRAGNVMDVTMYTNTFKSTI